MSIYCLKSYFNFGKNPFFTVVVLERNFTKSVVIFLFCLLPIWKRNKSANFIWIINRGTSKKGLGIPKNKNQFCASVAVLAVLALFQKAAGRTNLIFRECSHARFACCSLKTESRAESGCS